ncbi:MAG: hypothetical protein M1814_003559 [Vezdaea aestivalis]|nr:MAG: hypothetical protein M1814_003559 [Vezdaea aestivalis]
MSAQSYSSSKHSRSSKSSSQARLSNDNKRTSPPSGQVTLHPSHALLLQAYGPEAESTTGAGHAFDSTGQTHGYRHPASMGDRTHAMTRTSNFYPQRLDEEDLAVDFVTTTSGAQSTAATCQLEGPALVAEDHASNVGNGTYYAAGTDHPATTGLARVDNRQLQSTPMVRYPLTTAAVTQLDYQSELFYSMWRYVEQTPKEGTFADDVVAIADTKSQERRHGN